MTILAMHPTVSEPCATPLMLNAAGTQLRT